MDFSMSKPSSLRTMAKAVAILSRLHAGDHTYLEVYDDMIKFRSATGDKTFDCAFSFGMHYFDTFNPGPRMRFDDLMVVPTDIDQLAPNLLQRLAINSRALAHAFHLVGQQSVKTSADGTTRKCVVRLNLTRWTLGFDVQRQNFEGGSVIEISVLDRVELPVILNHVEDGQTARYRLEGAYTLMERSLVGFHAKTDAVSISITDGNTTGGIAAGLASDAAVIVTNKTLTTGASSRQSSASTTHTPITPNPNTVADQLFVTARTDFEVAVAADSVAIRISLPTLRAYMAFAKYLSASNKNVTMSLEWNSSVTPIRISIISNNAEHVDFESELSLLPTIDRETMVARGQLNLARLSRRNLSHEDPGNQLESAAVAGSLGRRRRGGGGGSNATPRRDLTGSRIRASAQRLRISRRAPDAAAAPAADADDDAVMVGDQHQVHVAAAAAAEMVQNGDYLPPAVHINRTSAVVSGAAYAIMHAAAALGDNSALLNVSGHQQPVVLEQQQHSARSSAIRPARPVSVAAAMPNHASQSAGAYRDVPEILRNEANQERVETPPPPPSLIPPVARPSQPINPEAFDQIIHLPGDFDDLEVADEQQQEEPQLENLSQQLQNCAVNAVRLSNDGFRTPQKASVYKPAAASNITPTRREQMNNLSRLRSFNNNTPHRSSSFARRTSAAELDAAAEQQFLNNKSINSSSILSRTHQQAPLSVDGSFVANSTPSQGNDGSGFSEKSESQLHAAKRTTVELLGHFMPWRQQRQYDLIEAIRHESSVPGTGQAFMLDFLREFVEKPELLAESEQNREEEFLFSPIA